MMHERRRRPDAWPWPVPSPRVRDLLRQAAELAVRIPAEAIDEVDRATLDPDWLKADADDPVITATIRRVNRATLIHWAAANVSEPGAPVAPELGHDALNLARDLVRRGQTELALAGYRAGQNAAWLGWMQIAFQLTSDPAELRELLDVSARSIAAYVDATLAAIAARMEAEREELTSGTHAVRREVVALLLDGAPISTQSASQRLGYALDQMHRAAIVWSDEPDLDMRVLERTAEALARAVGAERALTLSASVATLWAWVPGKAELDMSALRAALSSSPSVRVCIGSLARGREGFRRSHLDALSAQHVVATLHSTERIVRFDDVRLVALVTQNPEAAKTFVQHTLGKLASAPPELLQALRVVLHEGNNISRAAQVLHTHRNTVLRRITQAEALLPRSLEHSRIHVAVALDVLHWQPLGTRGTTAG